MFDSTANLLTSLGLNSADLIVEIRIETAESSDEHSGENAPDALAVIIPDG